MKVPLYLPPLATLDECTATATATATASADAAANTRSSSGSGAGIGTDTLPGGVTADPISAAADKGFAYFRNVNRTDAVGRNEITCTTFVLLFVLIVLVFTRFCHLVVLKCIYL